MLGNWRMIKKSGSGTCRVICAALTLCAALLLTACDGEKEGTGKAGQGTSTGQNRENAADGQDEEWLAARAKQDPRTRHDLRTEPENREKVERVDLNASESGKMILSAGGDIWLSGSLEGQVVIDAEEDELVHLYLAGVEIASANGPALRVEEASKVIVTLVSETENVLTDSPDYTGYEETPACLYSVCDLTFNGEGALHVSGYYEDGIRGKDRMKFLGCKVSVEAKGDGIRSNDGIYMREAFVDVECEKNGLRTVNRGADDRGVIEMNGGALSVIAGQNGVCAASDLYLYDGRWSVNAVMERLRTEGTAYLSEAGTARPSQKEF